MALWQIILGIITGIITLLLGVYASFTARQKGPIFSNVYIWGSEKDKKKVDKKAEYHFVTVIFGCLAVFLHWKQSIFSR